LKTGLKKEKKYGKGGREKKNRDKTNQPNHPAKIGRPT